MQVGDFGGFSESWASISLREDVTGKNTMEMKMGGTMGKRGGGV